MQIVPAEASFAAAPRTDVTWRRDGGSARSRRPCIVTATANALMLHDNVPRTHPDLRSNDNVPRIDSSDHAATAYGSVSLFSFLIHTG